MKRFMKLPSPAMVVASAALFVALGGTSYAVATGSIDGREVKNSSLTGADIQSKSIAGTDIKDGALAARDIKAGSLTADRFVGGQLPNTRWLLVDASGQIAAQSGGFSVTAGYPAAPAAANGNVYINANEDLGDNGIVSTIALQNAVDQGGSPTVNNGSDPLPDSNPEFSGEISATKCAIANVVTCAPTGTNNANHFVVSPRNSDGTRTGAGTRKRFYVVITD